MAKHMCGMIEGLPLDLPLRFQPSWATNPDPVGTELRAAGAGTETSLGDPWGNPPAADSPAQRTTQEAAGAQDPGGREAKHSSPSRAALPRPQAGLPHASWESRHPAPETSGDRPARAWSRRVGSGLGASWMGVGGEAWPKLSPVGGLGPAAARKTDFRRLF